LLHPRRGGGKKKNDGEDQAGKSKRERKTRNAPFLIGRAFQEQRRDRNPLPEKKPYLGREKDVPSDGEANFLGKRCQAPFLEEKRKFCSLNARKSKRESQAENDPSLSKGGRPTPGKKSSLQREKRAVFFSWQAFLLSGKRCQEKERYVIAATKKERSLSKFGGEKVVFT